MPKQIVLETTFLCKRDTARLVHKAVGINTDA